jgi:hypothetical protein
LRLHCTQKHKNPSRQVRRNINAHPDLMYKNPDYVYSES